MANVDGQLTILQPTDKKARQFYSRLTQGHKILEIKIFLSDRGMCVQADVKLLVNLPIKFSGQWCLYIVVMSAPRKQRRLMAMDVHISTYWLGALTVLTALGIFAGVVLAFYKVSRLKRRYSPFTEDTLRLPGHTLRVKHNELSDDLTLYYLFYLFTAIGLVLAFTLLNSHLREIFVVSAILFMLFVLYKVWQLFDELRKSRLGLEAEEYVGQELNLLLCRGAHVFHDIPYRYGNIDHIVVGSDKVFVIETKAISKPQALHKKNGRDPKVVFDGRKLIFPHMKTDEPIKQAQRHAEHVRDALRKNCGLSFDVVPVVALPGWYVEARSTGSGVLVINPRRGKALDRWLNKTDDKTNRNIVSVYIASVARSVSARSVLTDPNAGDKFDFWFDQKYVAPSL